MNIIFMYTSNVFSSILYIKQDMACIVNSPIDVPPKYIFFLMKILLSLTLLKHSNVSLSQGKEDVS
jgi:hypothetical protein